MIGIDMKMPKSCILCPFMDNDGWYVCDVNPEVVVSMDDERRAKNCPLIEVAAREMMNAKPTIEAKKEE